jgi:hypothetical protein
MTISVPTNALPPPATVSLRDESVRLRSAPGATIQAHVPDAEVQPRRFLLTWINAHGAVGDVIRRHWLDHCRATFLLELPGYGEVWLQWASAPQIPWSSAASANATAELDEVLAHE